MALSFLPEMLERKEKNIATVLYDSFRAIKSECIKKQMPTFLPAFVYFGMKELAYFADSFQLFHIDDFDFSTVHSDDFLLDERRQCADGVGCCHVRQTCQILA